MAPEGLPWRAL